jgi:hypothetical protein
MHIKKVAVSCMRLLAIYKPAKWWEHLGKITCLEKGKKIKRIKG